MLHKKDSLFREPIDAKGHGSDFDCRVKTLRNLFPCEERLPAAADAEPAALDSDVPAAVAIAELIERQRFAAIRTFYHVDAAGCRRLLEQFDRARSLDGRKSTKCCGRNDHRIERAVR